MQSWMISRLLWATNVKMQGRHIHVYICLSVCICLCVYLYTSSHQRTAVPQFPKHSETAEPCGEVTRAMKLYACKCLFCSCKFVKSCAKMQALQAAGQNKLLLSHEYIHDDL